MAVCHKKERIHCGFMSQEGEYLVWRYVTNRKISIMAPCRKKESILCGDMSIKKKSIHYGDIPQGGEYPLW